MPVPHTESTILLARVKVAVKNSFVEVWPLLVSW